MDMGARAIWQPLLLRLGGVIVAGLLAGAVVGQPWAGIAAALALVLAYTLWKLQRLHAWLHSRQHLPPDEQHGLWYALSALLRSRQRHVRQRHRRLLALLRQFREAAQALPDAVVYLDGDQRILWCNRAARSLLGLHPARDVGIGITQLLRNPRVVEWFASGAAEPLSDVAAPDDEQRRLGFRLIRYGDEGRQLLIARDTTQLMRLEQMRRDFVANVSHELRTPLTVLHGYLDLIEPDEAPSLAPMLGQMRAQSARMAQIVEDLLTLSRLDAGDREASERISMAGMLRILHQEAQSLSQGAHTIQVEETLQADLRGSVGDLHSAFSNLVSNAIRYTPPGGRVTLRWRADAGTEGAVFEVVDTGLGIAPHHLPRITERFYRVSNSRSRDSGGTGLGLSIVKHVLALHQARLEIESTPGAGSRFACVFGPERLRPAADQDD